VGCLLACPAFADPNATATGPLVDLINSGQYAFNALERLSATANQATYNALTANPAGATYCLVNQTAASATCPQQVFLVFRNLRSLVQTANALLGNDGPTRFSLNLTDQGLGNALRWTAAEELTAPGTAATQFTNSQIGNLRARLTALRYGATGFAVNNISLQSDGPAVASNAGAVRGGGASADDGGLVGSRWGGFLNSSYGWGTRSPTQLEDAFNYDSRDVNFGVDYRVTRHLLFGIVGGYTDQRINFNSSLSVVDGDIHSHGYSVQAFGMYEWERGAYVNFSIGAQRTLYDSSRLIEYPSENIAVPSVNATATGETHSTSFTSTFDAGWSLTYKALSVEPYVLGEYQHADLAAFSESSRNNTGTDAGAPAGFDFRFGAQHIAVFNAAIGTRLQLTFSTFFGTAAVYAKAELHHLFDDSPGTVLSSYNAVASTGVGFDIPSDRPTINFGEYGAGVSVVLPHRIQGFLEYQQSGGVPYVQSRVIQGGIRGAF
jgi:uncharacterized protein YhjY with autotransporter beta-barrel domain